MKDIQNYSLLAHNTFGIDAKCLRFLEYSNEAEAIEAARIVRESGLPFIIIGGGSNLLLTHDFQGIVVHSACKGIRRVGNTLLCGSGEVFDDVVAESLRQGLSGAENLSLIPGDVGASAVQNIGAYGAEAKDLIRSIRAVEIATGNLCVIENAECEYGYRQSRFKQDWKNQYLIVSVEYVFSDTFVPRLDYGNIRNELERRGIVHPTAQQVRETEALLADQHDIGDTERDRENEDEGKGQQHVGRSRRRKIVHDLARIESQGIAQRPVKIEQADKEEQRPEDREPGVVDRVVGIGIVAHLSDQSAQKQDDRDQQIDRNEERDRLFIPVRQVIQQNRCYSRQHGDIPDLRLFIQCIETDLHRFPVFQLSNGSAVGDLLFQFEKTDTGDDRGNEHDDPAEHCQDRHDRIPGKGIQYGENDRSDITADVDVF